MTKLLVALLNPLALLMLLLIAAFPNVAWPVTPSPLPNGVCSGPPPGVHTYPCAPRPAPQPTLPVNYDEFCASRHSGAYQGLATSPALGVVVMCEKADYRFYRSAVPTKWPRFPDAKATP
jgi:hypothetical protein